MRQRSPHTAQMKQNGETASGGPCDIMRHCRAAISLDAEVAEKWCQRNDAAARNKRLCGQVMQSSSRASQKNLSLDSVQLKVIGGRSCSSNIYTGCSMVYVGWQPPADTRNHRLGWLWQRGVEAGGACSIRLIMAAMHSRKKMGPRNEPCGTLNHCVVDH